MWTVVYPLEGLTAVSGAIGESASRRIHYDLVRHCGVLHPLLPQPKNFGHKLRQRSHNLVLSSNVNAVVKQNFIYRMLFRDIY